MNMVNMEARAVTLEIATKRLTRSRALKSALQSACKNCMFFREKACGYTSPYNDNSAGRLEHDLIENKNHHPSRNTAFRKVVKEKLPVPCDVPLRLGEPGIRDWLKAQSLGANAIQQSMVDYDDGKKLAANDRDE